MPTDSEVIELTQSELRVITRYAILCARVTLPIFERDFPEDQRPRLALDAAQAFADGARRSKQLRDSAWAAQRAAIAAGHAGRAAASEAARAALAASGAAFLHPLAKSTQVKHILGAAAHSARALELEATDEPTVENAFLEQARLLAPVVLVNVLRRYPSAPLGGGRVGALLRALDAALR